MTKIIAVLLFFCCSPCISAQKAVLNGDTLKNRPIGGDQPPGLLLNAKGGLIQSVLPDEIVDTEAGARVLSPKTTAGADSIKSLQTENQANSCLITVPNDSTIKAEINSAVTKLNGPLRDMGKYHKFTGGYIALCGILEIIAGAVLIDRPADAGLAGTLITVGGISIGFGLWEISIGGTFLKYGLNDPGGTRP
jgi:hypothetical protein